MGDRVAIFIDGSNLYHALKNNTGRYDLYFSGFITKLCDSRPLFRTYYYNILQDQITGLTLIKSSRIYRRLEQDTIPGGALRGAPK